MPVLKPILKAILAVFFLSALALVGCSTNSGSTTPTEPIQPAGPKTYTVTFVTNAGGGVFTNQTITEGSNAVRPAVPVRSGYNFVDWYKENSFNTVFLFDREKISNHLTLYAKWTTKLVVTFDSTGGSELARQEVTSNEKATKPEDPTRTGFTFAGWFTTAATNTKFDFDTVRIRANTTIYAAWQQNTYTVTFITNVGDPAFTVRRVLHSSNAVAPSPAPTRTGYDFLGWYSRAGTTEDGFKFDFSTGITEDTTIYAGWELKTYTVSFVTNDNGAVFSNQPVKHGNKTAQPDPEPTRVGYVVEGWFTTAAFNEKFDFNLVAITSNTTIYAKWVAGVRVIYNLNSGNLAGVGSGTVAKIEKVSTNLNFLRSSYPTRSDYFFGGWYKDAGFSKSQYFVPELEPITDATTLYAKWKSDNEVGSVPINFTNIAESGSLPLLWPTVYSSGSTWGMVRGTLPKMSNASVPNSYVAYWHDENNNRLQDNVKLNSLGRPVAWDNLSIVWGPAIIKADASKGFSLHADNANPAGLAYYNGHFYVGDEVDKKLYAYNATTGARDTSKEVISNLPPVLSLVHVDDAARKLQGFYMGGSDGVVRFYSNNGGANPSRTINLTSINANYGRVFGLDYKNGFLYGLVSRDAFDNLALIKFNVSENTVTSTQNEGSGFLGLLVDNQQVFINRSVSAGWTLVSYRSSDFSEQADKNLTLIYTGITSDPGSDFNSALTQHDGYYYLLNRRLKRVIAYPKP